MSDVLKFEQDGHLAVITLNRPEVLNALNRPLDEALVAAFETVRDDPSIWVAILTGAGDRAFCAGADLKWRADNESSIRDSAPDHRKRFNHPDFGLWKPVIAAVNGYAVGGGLELAISCDVIVASERAQFGLPEPRRGLMADAGGVHGLPRLIPSKLAMEMILTGEFVSAQKASESGLVNRVVQADDLMPTARSTAASMMECSPKALQAAKQAVALGMELPYWQAVEAEIPMFGRLRDSGDFIEGPKAFSEKRRPVWEGE